jgi:acetolactate synthase I/II/III large subunit
MTDVREASATADVLRQHGVGVVFAPIEPRNALLRTRLEESGVPVIGTLHEQTAAFAAEGWAKVTRLPGVLLLDGPVALPRAITGVANAFATGSPLVVVDDQRSSGHAPFVDHVGMARTITRSASRTGPEQLPSAMARACADSNHPPRGPVLVEIRPSGDRNVAAGEPASGSIEVPLSPEQDGEAVERIAALLSAAERPVVVAGGGVYWSKAEAALRRFAEDLQVPVVMNGMGRGTLPADHHLALSRARPTALREADLVLVAGTPIDFRLGYGRFGAARVVHLCEDDSQIATHVELAGAMAEDLGAIFEALTDATDAGARQTGWSERLRAEEVERRADDETHFAAPDTPILPRRFYGELRRRLARDAIVIGDGGDFVSYAGRYVDSFTPGCFLDPGPYGCLGVGVGYAMGARLAHPERQIVVLLGDGAAGFSLMEFDTLVRNGLAVVVVVGNNNAWGLEKHHMREFFGYDVLTDLAPDTRYDEVAKSLGGYGELVHDPAELAPALERAFASEAPALVNVVLDPADAYPRSTILA